MPNMPRQCLTRPILAAQEACFRDVVVLFRRKVAKEAGGEGEKEVLHLEADPAVAARNIHIKQFTGIPLADLASGMTPPACLPACWVMC